MDPEVIVTGGKEINPSWAFGAQISAAWPPAGDDREFFWADTAPDYLAGGGFNIQF
jgi:hypothetical protein